MGELDGRDEDDEGVQPKKRKITKSASLDKLGGGLDSPTGSLSPMSAGGSEGGGMQVEAGAAAGAAGGTVGRGGAVKGKGKKVAKVASPLNSDDEAELMPVSQSGGGRGGAVVKEEEEEEEENLDLEFGKYHAVDPDKMQSVLAKFTPDQMERYECYRRAGFQKTNMRRLLQSVAGCAISVPMTIVMSGIAKMFVGELVETGRIVMTERKETGPIRPCHIREAYRRLKLEGKVPMKGRPRLFR